MKQRQSDLFKSIVEQYIETAQPVGSRVLAQLPNFSVSPATIRNEMAGLEDLGYIKQPHTSAGRIPTESGYRYYVELLMDQTTLSQQQQEKLRTLADDRDSISRVKAYARASAETTQTACYVAFSPHSFYYTGLSHLFAQPEFAQHDLVCRLSQVIDHFDQVATQLFDYEIPEQAYTVLIGHDNPFSSVCSTVITQCTINDTPTVIGLLGPLRMNYQQTVGSMTFIHQVV